MSSNQYNGNGIGAIFIAIAPHGEGACNQLLNFLRLLPTSC